MTVSGSGSAALPGRLPGGGSTVSVIVATAIVVADMIGVGVFTSLGHQVEDLPASGFTLLTLWVVGGIVALCGGLCYAELATVFPRSGGEYNLLSKIYHRAVGFLAGWLSATVGFSAPTALAAMAFSSYLAGVWPGVPRVPLALAVVWAVAAVHLWGREVTTAFQDISTLLKVALIVIFVAAAFAFGGPPQISFTPTSADLGNIASPAFAVSLAYVMYSYAGWNAATYITGEVRDPERTLPSSILAGVVVVTLLYVSVNAVFLYTTPVGRLQGHEEVALIAGQHVFGDMGGRIVGAVICIGLIPSISAMMWLGPRVTMTMGEDFPLLSAFARKTRNGVPAVAILFQLAVVSLLLLTQSFQSIVQFIQFSLTISSFLAVLGVIVLRHTQPSLPRPYKVWGYPATPLLFLAVSLFMMINLLIERPVQALIGVGIMLSGLVIYAISRLHPAGWTRGKS
jgi:basic amino acid/polyamine antiporter, APA family